MASSHHNNPKETLPSHVEIPVINPNEEEDHINTINYSQRAQWLRAAMLGANDGLVTVTSLMIGVGAVRQDIRAMLLAGFAGLVAGACSMAIGEFVSVYTQRDIELAQMKRERAANNNTKEVEDDEKDKLPNPVQAAAASALAFSAGAVVPLVGAVFIRDYRVRMAVVAALASLALMVFGGVGAVIGKTSVRGSCVRVVIGGWMAMAITFGLTKLIGFTGL
ncbi:vacuolar iron transporter homolog 4-like [Prosopis cineraria]|uniref:vacuolar iron transporter homolog 4-like n=1 Tax=Prosopis cineraria TaxID=364024 RepID=UPI00240FA014|nr:vacuolar iron transporter homolog 4-like [Prosopis cineraria]XP_054792908.1 vacuolar iron transporter homolog 4-like [Prosopis cineraria]